MKPYPNPSYLSAVWIYYFEETENKFANEKGKINLIRRLPAALPQQHSFRDISDISILSCRCFSRFKNQLFMLLKKLSKLACHVSWIYSSVLSNA